jgi:hypothetical protein
MLSWFVVFRFGARAFVMVLFGAVVVLFRVLRFVLAMVEVVGWNWITLHLYRRLRRQNQKNCR